MKRDRRGERRAGRTDVPATHGRAGAARAGRPAAVRGHRRALVIAVALAAIALAGTVWWGSRTPRSAPRDAAVARALLEQGFALSREWRLEEALACFRRARDRSPEDDWLAHYAIANTALQLANHNVQRAGLPVNATRSSVERLALVREALAEYDRALLLAREPADRANVLSQRGDLCFLWGLMWEADASYEAAAALEPRVVERARKLVEFRDMLAHPELQLTTEEWMRRSPDER